jgi:hypothetical protein
VKFFTVPELHSGVLGMKVVDRLSLDDAGEALFIDARGVQLELISEEAFNNLLEPP